MASSKKDKINADLALCILLVFTDTFSVLDVWARSFLQRGLFQVNWIVILLCMIRLSFLLLSGPRNNKDERIRKIVDLYSPLILIWIYTGFLTLLFLSSPYEFLDENFFTMEHNPFQFVASRGIKYSTYLMLSFYVAITLKNQEKIKVFIRSLTFLLCITEVLAVIQLIVFQITNVNILPIIRTNIESGFQYINAVISFGGLNLLRVNSVSHEPKGLASSMCLLLLIKIYWNTFRQEFSPGQRDLSLDVYVKSTTSLTPLVLIATFSTNAILYLFSVAFFVLLFGFKKNFSWKISRAKLILLSFFLSLLLLFLSLDTSGSVKGIFSSAFDASVGRRLGAFIDSSTITNLQNSIDPEDGAIFYIFDNYSLSNILRGFGFGGFSNTAYPFVSLRYGRDIVSPFSRNIFIELLFSSGIFGVITSLYFFWKISRTQTLRRSSIFKIFGTFTILNVFLRSSEVLFFVSISVLVSTVWIYDNLQLVKK